MELMPILFFVATCIALMAGYPVALTLSGVAILFALLGMATGTFDSSVLTFTPNRLFGIISNQTLIAVPLFVFMGVMLEKSRVAENLLSTMARRRSSRRSNTLASTSSFPLRGQPALKAGLYPEGHTTAH